MTTLFDPAAIRERCEKSTPDMAVEVDEQSLRVFVVRHAKKRTIRIAELIADNQHQDAQFIAHARQDIPMLLARVEELERENAEYRDHMARHYPARGSELGDMTALEEVKHDADFFSKETDRLKESLDEYRKLWQAAEAEVTRLHASITSLRSHLAQLTAERDEAVRERDECQREIAGLVVECERLRAQAPVHGYTPGAARLIGELQAERDAAIARAEKAESLVAQYRDAAQAPITAEEVRDALEAGARERKVAEKTLKRSPRR